MYFNCVDLMNTKKASVHYFLFGKGISFSIAPALNL